MIRTIAAGAASRIQSMLDSGYYFLHARTDQAGCRIAGYIRLSLALIILFDRLLLGFDLRKYFHPEEGMIHYRASQAAVEDFQISVFQLAPDSWLLVQVVYWLGVWASINLALGIAPRFHVILLYFHVYNMFNHNTLVYDQEDLMMKVFIFLLSWLPLHHITIYDRFGTKPISDEDSWPMWPFRLWQIYMSFIYFSTFLGKVVGEPWRNGTALYRVIHGTDFYPGIFNPDFLFNRMWFLYIATYLALLVEGLGWLLIWPLYTRRITLIIILLFHVGLDVAMTMHIFEYLTMVGWLVFLVEEPKRIEECAPHSQIEESLDPSSAVVEETSSPDEFVHKQERITKKDGLPVKWTMRRLVDTSIFLVFFIMFAAENISGSDITFLTPKRFQPYVQKYLAAPLEYFFWSTPVRNILAWSGLHCGPWTVYGGEPDDTNHRYEAEIRFFPSGYPESSDQIDIPLVLWKSPDYGSLNGWQKKRHTRNMNYLEYVADSGPAQIALCEYLSRQFARPDRRVSSVRLIGYMDYSVPVPSDLDWFRSPARQPMVTDTTHLYTLFTETFNFDYSDKIGILDHFAEVQEPPLSHEYVDESEYRAHEEESSRDMDKTSTGTHTDECRHGDATCQANGYDAVSSTETQLDSDGTVLKSNSDDPPLERSATTEL
jgi:Vitamin K-dependent gamma-carboxylase